MQITQEKSDGTLRIHLAGRLDASWSGTVQKAFDEAIRNGEHAIDLDMEQVDYFSSAGLGVILTAYKKLHAIKGRLVICKASPFVRTGLTMAGLATLINAPAEDPAPAATGPESRTLDSEAARCEVFALGSGGMTLTAVGDSEWIDHGLAVEGEAIRAFGPDTAALGIGALGSDAADCRPRLGEFLSVAGAATFQPTDGSTRPDFLVSQGDYLPSGLLAHGLEGRGEFSHLVRFEKIPDAPAVRLSELARVCLGVAAGGAAVVVALAETSGLVGASLRQAPSVPGAGRFQFPEIRDWLSFAGQRTHCDTTSLLVGVVAQDAHPLAAHLRPLGQGLLGHFHAAAFPYHPLQKGRIDLDAAVRALFESSQPTSILHLVSDTRDFIGAGESDFLRGAIWVAAAQSTIQP